MITDAGWHKEFPAGKNLWDSTRSCWTDYIPGAQGMPRDPQEMENVYGTFIRPTWTIRKKMEGR